jgi:hypothetical protein
MLCPCVSCRESHSIARRTRDRPARRATSTRATCGTTTTTMRSVTSTP